MVSSFLAFSLKTIARTARITPPSPVQQKAMLHKLSTKLAIPTEGNFFFTTVFSILVPFRSDMMSEQ